MDKCLFCDKNHRKPIPALCAARGKAFKVITKTVPEALALRRIAQGDIDLDFAAQRFLKRVGRKKKKKTTKKRAAKRTSRRAN